MGKKETPFVTSDIYHAAAISFLTHKAPTLIKRNEFVTFVFEDNDEASKALQEFYSKKTEFLYFIEIIKRLKVMMMSIKNKKQ